MSKGLNRRIILILGLLCALFSTPTREIDAATKSESLEHRQPSTTLGPPARPSTGAGYRRGEVLVVFEPGAEERASKDHTLDGARQLLAQVGARATDISSPLGVQRWSVPDGEELALAAQLSAFSDIAYAEPNYRLRAHLVPDDPYYTSQWAHPRIGSHNAWNLTTGDSAVVVAVIDTGVDLENPELQGRLTAPKSYVAGAPTADDDQGHGTHVAGIIAAAGNNQQGVAGMAWEVQIMPIKVLDDTGWGDSSDVAQGIVYAVNNGADIINVSLGGPDSSMTLLNAVTYAADNGVLVVGSAGNCGDGNFQQNGCTAENQAVYPAAYDEQVFAVAATDSADIVASFSNRGDYVDIAAPGVKILSTYIGGSGYAYASGTSQAAPFVSGLAALLLSVRPSLTPQEIQTIIETSATDRGADGWDPDYGAGRIQAAASMAEVAELEPPTLWPIQNPERDGTFVVDWSDVVDATSYTLEEDDNADFTSPTTRYSGGGTATLITSQTEGTWYYRVRAAYQSVGLSSPWSASQSVDVGLDAPQIQPIANAGTNTFTVVWQEVEAATAYRLQESRSADFDVAQTYAVGANLSYPITVTEGGTWHYRVQAYNSQITGPWSASEEVLVVPTAPTLAPIATGVVSDAYTLTWFSVIGADGYRLQESDTVSFTDVLTRYVGPQTTYEVTGQRGGVWHYRVQAYNGAGYSAASNTQRITVTVPMIDTPILDPISNREEPDTYTVAWSSVPSTTLYILEESATPWFEAPTVAYTGAVPGAAITNQPAGRWHYRVRAQTPAGAGPWSGSQSAHVIWRSFLPIVTRGTSN